MRWTRGNRSQNIEDRRGQKAGLGGMGGGGGGGGGLPIQLIMKLLGSKMGIVGVILILALSFFGGGDLLKKFGFGGNQSGSQLAGTGQEGPAADYKASAEEEEVVDFISFVLDDAQKTWQGKFDEVGQRYRESKLVIFTDSVSSGCGPAQSAMGPFYCPADEKMYIDLAFYHDLKSRFGAPGDFAQAYVLAHELGHHVQNVLGYSKRMRAQQKAEPSRKNELSIRLELQADCMAGIWANSTAQRQLLEVGDVKEAMGAAAAVGDDRLQKSATGRVNKESWTHGSSEQRMKWFMTGFESGSIESCDTFKPARI